MINSISPIAYPTSRLLGNPEVLEAIANHFNYDPDGLSSAFYTLQEIQLEKEEGLFEFNDDITYFQYDLENQSIHIQSVETGVYVVMKQTIESLGEEVLELSNKMNNFIKDCLKQASYVTVAKKDEFNENLNTDQIVLNPPPTPQNNFLSSTRGNTLEGNFNFLTNSKNSYKFMINIIDGESKKVDTVIEQVSDLPKSNTAEAND